jgi:hypothetical protein
MLKAKRLRPEMRGIMPKRLVRRPRWLDFASFGCLTVRRKPSAHITTTTRKHVMRITSFIPNSTFLSIKCREIGEDKAAFSFLKS